LTLHGRGCRVLLVLVACLLGADLLPIAGAQGPCGTWSGEPSDEKIQLTQVGESLGGECRGVFVLSAGIRVPDRYDVTLELDPSHLTNARIEWISTEGSREGEQSALLVPSLELELHALPVDRYAGAQVSLEGDITPAATAVDVAGLLLRTALALTDAVSCEIPDSQLAHTATMVSPMLDPVVRRVWDGNLVGAEGELDHLLPGLLEQSSSLLQENGVSCGVESLTAAAAQPAILQRLEAQFLAWLPVKLYEYFEYQKQPAFVTLEYLASPVVTSAPVTATPELASPAEREVLEVLRRYEEIRIRSHGPSHDITGLEEVLAESSLESHLDSVEWQRENNAYYLITVHASNVEEIIVVSPTRIDVLVDKIESREFYIDGKLGTENTVYDDHYQVRYQFKLINESWYIVDRAVITPTPAASEFGTATPIPTARPATATPAPLASNVRDFSGTQGVKGWKYLMENSRNSGSWTEMRFGDYHGKSCWLTGNWETDVRICGDGELAPGMSTRVAYEWRTDVTRRVALRVRAQKIDTRCGDGIQVTVQRVVDGQGSRTLESFRIAANDSRGVLKSYSVDVGPGVFIFVFVDIVGNSQCDTSRVTIDVY
jgi:hypothetical protein